MERGCSVQASQQVGSTSGCFRLVVALLLFAGLVTTGCRSPAQFRENADKVTDQIIAQKQMDALGTTQPLRIERPSDILRRRLIEQQKLPVSSTASLGTDQLAPIPHWPDKTYPPETHSPDANIPIEPNEQLEISLIDALQVAAHNSPEYQSRKEDLFRVALDLDLARNRFRNIFSLTADSQITTDTTRDPTVTSVNSGVDGRVTRLLENGAALTAAIGIDLLNLLTQGGSSSLGLNLDTSVSIPLLRGSSRYVVLESLTQAEREVVYEIWDFERYKRTFAVNIATSYLNVLQQEDSLKNNLSNYKAAILSARTARRQGDAGRLKVIEVDQAIQRELQSRSGWISADQQYQNRLDTFKVLIGLPADALIKVDANDLRPLQERGLKYVEEMKAASQTAAAETAPPADAPVETLPPSRDDGGPYEIDESVAIRLALENRLDLRVANGRVYDAQRQVVVAADALRTGLTLTGAARLEGDDDEGGVSFRGGRYSAGLLLNLPIERTAERNAYRTSLINLERVTRSVQTTEDQIKAAIRNELRTLLEARESLKIAAQSVVIAESSVRNQTLSLEAGRVIIRDLLEAQDTKLAAQLGLTSAIIRYRTAELQLQRDLDLLKITKEGLLQEVAPEEIKI